MGGRHLFNARHVGDQIGTQTPNSMRPAFPTGLSQNLPNLAAFSPRTHELLQLLYSFPSLLPAPCDHHSDICDQQDRAECAAEPSNYHPKRTFRAMDGNRNRH